MKVLVVLKILDGWFVGVVMDFVIIVVFGSGYVYVEIWFFLEVDM